MKKLCTIILFAILSACVFGETRNALLIANAKYKNFGALTTPVNESKALKKTLEKLGFTVTVVENGSREKMCDALDDFQQKIQQSGGIGFFHYGGHAVQVNGKNYLIPVDADIPDERKVSSRAVDVDDVMASMQADTNIVILDACRNNPLPSGRSRSASRGLGIVENKPVNSVIVYSAQPGKVALDGVFTPILTEKLLEKKEFSTILREVRKEVTLKTNGEQNPGEYNELVNEIYLAGYSDTFLNLSMNNDYEYIKLGDEAYKNGNYSLAFYYYGEAHEIENPESQFYLGNLYNQLLPKITDEEAAFYYYRKSAEQGYSYGQNALGWCYYNGQGIEKNYEKAKELYELAAAQGNVLAENNMGIYYYYGFAEKSDYIKAREWFEKASKKGFSDSQYYLGMIYLDGLEVEKNYEKARKLFEKSAAQNNILALFELGYMYEIGAGGKQDYVEARRLYEKVVSIGFPNDRALFRLGLLYFYGLGVEQDYEMAEEFLFQSASQENAEALEFWNKVYEELKSKK